ncbi:MAG: NADH-quinone oxidoreductase subunit J [Candidatus Kapaibacterium sp.]
MVLLDIIFYLFAILILVSAAVVAFSKNIMYAAFSLLFTFFGVAGMYVLLNADFIAITQIMIYIGGILVLIIFGVMLTTKITGVDVKSGTLGRLQVWTAGIVSAAIAVLLAIMYCTVDWHTAELPEKINPSINEIGFLLLTDYLIAFEAASILLLIAIIGAALIARRRS